MKLFLITQFIQPNIYQLLSFRHVINIKVVNELFYILFVLVLSPKPGVYFTLRAQLTSDRPHFKCWLVTHRYCPPHRTTQHAVCPTRPLGRMYNAYPGAVLMLTLWQQRDRTLQASAQMPQWVQETPIPSAFSPAPFNQARFPQCVPCSSRAAVKRTKAYWQEDLSSRKRGWIFPPTPRAKKPGIRVQPWTNLHHRTEPFVSQRLHVFIGTKDGTRWFWRFLLVPKLA